MITTQNEYLSKLDVLQNINYPAYALMPTAEKFYEIDVTTRQVEPITLSSIQRDHKAETLYFTVKRFVDYMDLSRTNCVIQYNVDGKTRYYPVPFYDIYTNAYKGEIILPWCLDYAVTKNAANVQFSIQFFKIDELLTERNDVEHIVSYSLNTLPSILVIKKGLAELQLDTDEAYLQPKERQLLMNYVDKKMDTLSRKVYWTVVDDSFTGSNIDTTGIQTALTNVFDELTAIEDLEHLGEVKES